MIIKLSRYPVFIASGIYGTIKFVCVLIAVKIISKLSEQWQSLLKNNYSLELLTSQMLFWRLSNCIFAE